MRITDDTVDVQGGYRRMKYDFDTLINRTNTGSEKWDMMREGGAELSPDIVPFSVADMEFKPAPELIEGLKKYLDQAVLGYTGATDAYYEAIIRFMERRHGFTPKKEWIVESAGIVPALKQMVAAFTEPGDSVMIMRPVYYPFTMAVEENKRKLIVSELLEKGDTYEIDFEDLEKKVALPEVKLLIFCSPHNPVGRVWTKEEILRVCDICLKNHVFIISDEIHFDIIMPGCQHISMGNLEKEYLNNCAICTAPTKSFNIAGLQVSNLIIPNKEYREKITAPRGYYSLNIISYKACELAYNNCEEWLDEMVLYVDGNRRFAEKFFAERLPMIRVFKLQGTYLLWLDCRALGMEAEELEKFMKTKAQLFLDEGYIFGESGRGYERVNLACPRRVLEKALLRLETAVKALEL